MKKIQKYIDDLMHREFQCDEAGYERKADRLATREFGYRSIHNAIRLDDPVRGISCVGEIQIRSMDQHACAEIEHELAYKLELEVPTTFRRSLPELPGY